jgi:hypothetical protein
MKDSTILEITNIIHKRNGISYEVAFEAANEIAKVVDASLADALVSSCNFGEILTTFGLEIRSKG